MKPVIAVEVAVREVEPHHHLAMGIQTLNALRCANAGRGFRFRRLVRVGCFALKTFGQHRIRIWSKGRGAYDASYPDDLILWNGMCTN